MGCKFCFATFADSKDFLPKGHLSKDESLQLIDKIIETGFDKITFAGGEPTLCKWLPELIEKSKKGGLTTMIVTNGTFLSDEYLDKLKGNLDWITLSIDSLNSETNIKSGRYGRNIIPNENYYRGIISRIRSKGFKVKINTVVSRVNYKEIMDSFIRSVNPKRWKIFQVLPIKGENDEHISKLIISPKQFEYFLNNHKNVEKDGIAFIPETNIDMTASYVMIDPAGRFYDNSTGELYYSDEILKVGIEKAYSQVIVDENKFKNRNGIYDWKSA